MEQELSSSILRSKGYFWLATRNSIAGFWSQAGSVISAEPGGEWWAETPRDSWAIEDEAEIAEIESIWEEPFGDRRQELVIIGQNLSQLKVTMALDDCLLTDAELNLGSEAWVEFLDPFSPWELNAEETEGGAEDDDSRHA